jgi:hypothetical protein
MVDDLNHVQGTRCLRDQGLRREIHRVRDQSVRTQVSEINVYVENHFPKELQLESLQLSDEVMLSE